MFCDQCGSEIGPGQRYCRICGKPAGDAPPPPAASRLAGHLRLVAIFWIGISALRLVPAIVFMVLFRSGVPWPIPAEGVPLVSVIFRVFGLMFLLLAAAGFAVGWGLLERAPWARMAAIVLGALSLLEMPLGTALGVYTLWVLLPAEAEQEYMRGSRVN